MVPGQTGKWPLEKIMKTGKGKEGELRQEANGGFQEKERKGECNRKQRVWWRWGLGYLLAANACLCFKPLLPFIGPGRIM